MAGETAAEPKGISKAFNLLAKATLAVLGCIAAHFIIDATGLGAVFYPLAHTFGDTTGLSGFGEWLADAFGLDTGPGYLADAGHNHGGGDWLSPAEDMRHTDNFNHAGHDHSSHIDHSTHDHTDHAGHNHDELDKIISETAPEAAPEVGW